MNQEVDKATLWVARATFLFLSGVLGFLIVRCGAQFVWQTLKDMPYLWLIVTGYIAAAWVSFSKQAPPFDAGEPKADKDAYRRIATMLTIFAISGIVIAIWLWIAMK